MMYFLNTTIDDLDPIVFKNDKYRLFVHLEGNFLVLRRNNRILSTIQRDYKHLLNVQSEELVNKFIYSELMD